MAGPDAYTGPKGPVTTQPSATEQDAARVRDLLSNPPANTNSRLAGAGRLAAFDAANQAGQSDSLGRAAGAGIGGFLSGLINKRADEQIIDRPQQLARAQAQLQLDSAAEKARGEREASAAQTRLHSAEADYYSQRPWLEEQKRADAASQRERTVVLQNLRLLKGTKLDPNNPQHMALLQRAANAGVFVDPEEWNNSSGNNITLTLTDPADPTKTNTVIFNKVTQTPTVVGQRGFQPTRDESGMTASERGNLQLGGARLGETQRHNRVTEAQGDARDALSRQRFDFQKAVNDQRTSERGRKELADANKLAAQSEGLARAAQDLEGKTTYRDPTSAKSASRRSGPRSATSISRRPRRSGVSSWILTAISSRRLTAKRHG